MTAEQTSSAEKAERWEERSGTRWSVALRMIGWNALSSA